MTAPILTKKKFWIIKPSAGRNEIWNPRFDPPEGVTYWTGTNASISLTGEETRRNSYSMKVTPVSGTAGTAYYNRGLKVTSGLKYTFSCDVKGVAGQPMRIVIATSTGTARATKTFTATGYWQRVEVTLSATETVTNYRVQVTRDSVSSTLPFYVDGVQFEQTDKASTFISGWEGEGYSWEGASRNSASLRAMDCKTGGELLDLEDYCQLVQVTGLGHGDWNQILTKMTSGGDLYQGHIRKSRQFSLIVDFIGETLGEIEANRKAIIDAIRPDLFEGEMVVRYQGFDDNDVEATNPIDIRCIPLPATLTDTPDLPNHQRAVLNFEIPSGLLDGAYREGGELNLYAEFAADYIVRRDPNGNWCEWNSGTSSYDSLITGLTGSVYCMAQGPDGKIYVGGNFTNAGGVTDADCLARWNPVSETWEAVIAGIAGTPSYIQCMAFDANGDLYIGGNFADLGSTDGDCIVKITGLNGTPTVNALGTGLNNVCYSIVIGADGNVYAGGNFTLAGGVANTAKIARWNGTSWSPLSTGLNNAVRALALAPNGDLYIGGDFTNAEYPYLCKWNGTAFSVVGTNTDIGGAVYALAFGATGNLYVGGVFTNAGGNASADYIAKWSGSRWESLGTGVNLTVFGISVDSGKVYASGSFTAAGGLTNANRVAVWTNGSWQPLDIKLPGTTTYVYSFLPASDGSLYIGGGFSTLAESVNAESGQVALNLNVSSGSANTYPRMQIIGPGKLYSITNYTTGAQIAFNDLTLLAGERLDLNFDPLNLKFTSSWAGRGNLLRYINPGSDYGNFYLKPGVNSISVFMDKATTTAATNAWITWKPKFWGIDGALLE